MLKKILLILITNIVIVNYTFTQNNDNFILSNDKAIDINSDNALPQPIVLNFIKNHIIENSFHTKEELISFFGNPLKISNKDNISLIGFDSLVEIEIYEYQKCNYYFVPSKDQNKVYKAQLNRSGLSDFFKEVSKNSDTLYELDPSDELIDYSSLFLERGVMKYYSENYTVLIYYNDFSIQMIEIEYKFL